MNKAKAFDYYDCADWHDSKGNKVKNWKQKMQAVWFKDENKIQTQNTQVKNTSGLERNLVLINGRWDYAPE